MLTSYVLSGVVEVMNCMIVVTFFFFCANIFISECSMMCINFTEELLIYKTVDEYADDNLMST